MDRRILIQVTAPAVLIGLVLLGTCIAGAWYIYRLQSDMNRVLSQNVRSLEAAQQLEIRVRQLRFHSLRNLVDPQHSSLEPIQKDHEGFEKALEEARESVYSTEEKAWVQKISEGYQKYHSEMDQLQSEIAKGTSRTDPGKFLEAHPINYVVEPCQELLRVNKEAIDATAQENRHVGRQVRLILILFGIAGPVGGLIIGFGVARGLSRSIYQLSVRVQDVAHRLDQDVASVSVAAGGDFQNLDNQLQHVVARVEDVAERIRRHHAEMLRAEQLSAVGQLAASVAHEIRNPLTSVKMLVDAVLRTQNRKPLTLEDLQVIHAEVGRLEKTVQGLLDFARPPAPQRSTSDLRQVVDQAVDLIRARARQQKVVVEVAAPDHAVTADIDRGQWCTVLVNLFLNALDVMPQGGCLKVEFECVAGTLGVPSAHPGRNDLRLIVTDTGAGIPPEIMDRLFVPFASTKPTGTGLGLSISRRIIEDHGGRLTAANTPQGGATFIISLPMEQGSGVKDRKSEIRGRESEKKLVPIMRTDL
jgi:signal transduction histidine kinase